MTERTDLVSTAAPSFEVTESSSNEVSVDAELNLRMIYLAIGVIGMMGNGLVVTLMATSRKLRSSNANIYIINQSTIDFLAAFFVIGHMIVRRMVWVTSYLGQELFCRLWMTNIFLWSLMVASSYNLVCVAIDRYFAIVHPWSHKTKCTKFTLAASLVVAWAIGFGWKFATIQTTTWFIEGKCLVYMYPSQAAQKAVGIIQVILQFLLPIIIFLVCYTRIVVVLKSGAWGSSESSKGVGEVKSAAMAARKGRMDRASRNTIVTMVMVCGAFFLCWVCNQVYYTMFLLGHKADFTSTFYHFTVVATFCNCCVNPFVYMAKYEQFQTRVVSVFKLHRCSRRAHDEDSSVDGKGPSGSMASTYAVDTK